MVELLKDFKDSVVQAFYNLLAYILRGLALALAEVLYFVDKWKKNKENKKLKER